MKKIGRKRIGTKRLAKKISVDFKNKDDVFTIIFAILGIALIIAFYLYMKKLAP